MLFYRKYFKICIIITNTIMYVPSELALAFIRICWSLRNKLRIELIGSINPVFFFFLLSTSFVIWSWILISWDFFSSIRIFCVWFKKTPNFFHSAIPLSFYRLWNIINQLIILSIFWKRSLLHHIFIFKFIHVCRRYAI